MSVKFQLDNGELKEYPTCKTLRCDSEYRPEMPYRTKCGLFFKDDPKGGTGACGHLECAIDAAKGEALFLPILTCVFAVWMTVCGWHEHENICRSFQESIALIIIFGSLSVRSTISPTRRWLELREYKNKGTIHGIGARRL